MRKERASIDTDGRHRAHRAGRPSHRLFCAAVDLDDCAGHGAGGESVSPLLCKRPVKEGTGMKIVALVLPRWLSKLLGGQKD